MSKLFHSEKKVSIAVFLIPFLIVVLSGILIQSIILPRGFPQQSSEAGLLKGTDSAVYHQIAVDEFYRLKREGLKNWTLLPSKDKVLVSGLLSLAYTLSGILSPLFFLPITALCHGLSCLFLFKILRLTKLDLLAALFGTAIFAVLPASYIWIFHPHKESIYILGCLLFYFSCFHFYRGQTVRQLVPASATAVSGLLCIWITRPFLVPFFSVGLLGLGAIIYFQRRKTWVPKPQVLVIAILCVSSFFLPQFYTGAALGHPGVEQTFEYNHQLPIVISSKLETISYCRYLFLGWHEHTRLAVDPDTCFNCDWDVIRYVPKAIYVGLFAPIGTCEISPGMLFFSIHTIFFLCALVIMIFAFPNRSDWGIWTIFGAIFLAILLARVLVTPNAGSLWRYLFAGKSMIIACGSGIGFGWCQKAFLEKLKHRGLGILNETFIVITGKTLVVVGSLAGVKILTSLLARESYGELTVLLSLVLISQYTFGIGLEQTAMRYFSMSKNQCTLHLYIKKLLFWWFAGSVAVVVFLVIIRLFVLTRISLPLLGGCVFVATAGMGLNLFCGIHSGARNRLLVAFLQPMTEWGRFIVATVCILTIGTNVSSVILGFSLTMGGALCVYAFFTKRLFNHMTPSTYGKKVLIDNGYFWTMVIGGFFSWIQIFSDRWCVAYFLNPADTGLYQALYQISYSPALIISSMLLTIIAPILFHHAQDGKNKTQMRVVMNRYNRFILCLMALSLTAFAAAWLVKDLIPALLLGENYRSSSSYFPWMVLSGMLFMLAQQFILSLCAGMKMSTIIFLRASIGIAALLCYGISVYYAGLPGAVFGGLCLSLGSVCVTAILHRMLHNSYHFGEVKTQ